MGAADSKEQPWGCFEKACESRESKIVIGTPKTVNVRVEPARGRDSPARVAHSEPTPTEQDPGPTGYYVSGPPPDDQSWRLNPSSSEAVGIGAYFGRVEGQTDGAARVIRIAKGGAAEHSGEIELGDALCSVDDVPVYGMPLCELGKYVLGTSGSVVKMSFEKPSGRAYGVQLVRGKGMLTVM
eukprot:CAMPEP_0173414610 /NCGR_PEP_ID=MMETSP1356-20130122/84419_1 /TAXON_ID=77927 ORGANISM="Hemiselmis virescens, Strain PCC157" /NCGR_SAMPLE_ID=MMETSP1356 /ASSEMBLY_ACC=CAM_ASM_000847 /LENGTH=182 /DNA_ID=CAMNT_0014376803 /DNA_START=156 /DNA_END=704 /DNA_ORIENTATION=+